MTRLAIPIFDQVHPKNFWTNFWFLWIYINMQKISLFRWFVLEIWLIKKILQFDWLRTFWTISQEQKCSQTWDLFRNTANNINFNHWTNSVKIITIYFNKFKKLCFGPFLVHLPNFGGQKHFSRKSGSVTHNFIWVSSTMPKFFKKRWYNSNKISRKKDRRKDGQKVQ